MSEEKISSLTELYDRTKRCAGITIPKNSLIVVEDLRVYDTRDSYRLALDSISGAISLVAYELLIAGVEDIYVAFENAPVPNESIASNIESSINNFRDSHRPNAKIHYKHVVEDGDSKEYLGEYDSVVVILRNNRNAIQEELLHFTSKKVVALFLESSHPPKLNGNILAFENSDGKNPKEISCPSLDEQEFANDFKMNYRVVTQAVYMLCSDDLKDCFQKNLKLFRVLETDAKFVKDIFEKFKQQGVSNESGTVVFFKDLIRGCTYFPNINDDRISIARVSRSAGLSEWITRTYEVVPQGWSPSELAELFKREDALANPTENNANQEANNEIAEEPTSDLN